MESMRSRSLRLLTVLAALLLLTACGTLGLEPGAGEWTRNDDRWESVEIEGVEVHARIYPDARDVPVMVTVINHRDEAIGVMVLRDGVLVGEPGELGPGAPLRDGELELHNRRTTRLTLGPGGAPLRSGDAIDGVIRITGPHGSDELPIRFRVVRVDTTLSNIGVGVLSIVLLPIALPVMLYMAISGNWC